MSDLLERFENQKPSEFRARTEESLTWFRDQMRGTRANVRQFYKQSDLKKTRRYLEGRMYTYFYDPKYSDILRYISCHINFTIRTKWFYGVKLSLHTT